MQEQVFELLLEQEDVSWKTILYDLVKTEQMNPWNIDITLLTQKYIQIIKEMQEHNFRISGKILLAAAFLLKMKSAHLVDNDLSNFDKLINQTEEDIDELLGEVDENSTGRDREKYQLIPKNPQPRNRKVSIQDLVDALQKAMESKKRILERTKPVPYEFPKRKMDIMEVIRDVYHKIVYYTNKEQKRTLTFTELLPPQAGKKEKVYTFIPLLHLENQHKVETTQAQPFQEIMVRLLKHKAQ